MGARMCISPRYFEALALLSQALEALDELGESIAAAHLSGVIDIVSDRIGEPAIWEN